jgi:hypothetical protein
MVGFDAKNKDKIPTLYICRLCTFILREPFQLLCGHRQCKTCIDSVEGYIKINFYLKMKNFILLRDFIKCAECQEETPKSEVSILKTFLYQK